MHHDAIVVGGSFAGLSAAMYIARARRSVCIVDTGLPRNRYAEHSHGFFTRDGSTPDVMRSIARAQVDAYPETRFVDGEAVKAAKTSDGFRVTLANGNVLEASRLVLAYGMRDELPDIPGLAARWGKTVLPCPYCHGYEFSDQALGVLGVAPLSVHQATLIAEWGPTTLYLNGIDEPEGDVLAGLEQRGICIERASVKALHYDGQQLIELDDGRTSRVDALYTATRLHFNSPLARQLGCAMDDMPFGHVIRTDAQQLTTVPGVFAAGDIARGSHSISWASADGVMAGAALHRSLVF